MADLSSTVLQAEGLSVGYGRRTAVTVLSDVRIRLKRGELVSLVGPNGSGKSTLLRSIAKIHAPIAGELLLNGKNIRKLSQMELAKLLGVVLTDRVNATAFPAYKVVELGRYPHSNWTGTLTPHDQAVVRWAIGAAGAEHLATREIGHLSDGERQRVMVARALAQEPTILLLDEPTAFLDLPARVELLALLQRLAREQHLAIVFSTHDLELALRTADTLWLLTKGRLHSGAPEDLILSGQLGSVFASDWIRFDPEQRTFRLSIPVRGTAAVIGEGLAASLAEAVLEREGFRLGKANTGPALTVTVSSASHWQAAYGVQGAHGSNYRELAEFARQLSVP